MSVYGDDEADEIPEGSIFLCADMQRTCDVIDL